ncbi:MAG: hypothetical protein KQJ78_05955 [Deltaproteobacteria bacterium]|nr:hypothetical protein [Deltaproteobacteria bacterium]
MHPWHGFFRSVLVAVLLTVWGAGAAAAQEFMADTMSRMGQTSEYLRLYVKDGNMRMQRLGGVGYTIVRRDRGVVWVVYPERGVYLELPLDPASLPLGTTRLAGEISRRPAGVSIVANRPCRMYEVTTQVQGRQQKVRACLSEELKTALSVEAEDGSFASRVTKVYEGRVPARLLEVPAGYKKITRE